MGHRLLLAAACLALPPASIAACKGEVLPAPAAGMDAQAPGGECQPGWHDPHTVRGPVADPQWSGPVSYCCPDDAGPNVVAVAGFNSPRLSFSNAACSFQNSHPCVPIGSAGADCGQFMCCVPVDEATSAFLGSWTCAETTDAGQPVGTRTYNIVAIASGVIGFLYFDGSLCSPDRWTVSGPVATAPVGATCAYGLEGNFTLDFATFTVNGSTAVIEESRTFDSDAGRNAGITEVTGGSCTKK